ncbi:sigma-70 family RNA polymerase sigma factor [Planococcus sp. YIM B11945]|uniref:sigma-70 family RNA polymerase sigma factor n=1 Tax=Planococcus sp. YIM B11945 TaxID=3435410 RepID=UPI003D7DE56E
MEHFELVMAQYTPMVSAIIRKLHIYRDHDAFRQVGYVALWQAYDRFDEEKGNFTPFAYRSIHGAMLDELKRQSRISATSVIMENNSFEWIEDNRTEDTLPEWLDEVVLSQAERELLEQLFVQGKSVSELAVAHALSLAGMKKRRERLLKKVKEQLETL